MHLFQPFLSKTYLQGQAFSPKKTANIPVATPNDQHKGSAQPKMRMA